MSDQSIFGRLSSYLHHEKLDIRMIWMYFFLFTNLKKDVDAEKAFGDRIPPFSDSNDRLWQCQELRSKIWWRVLQHTEVWRTDSAWTRGLNFRVTLQFVFFLLRKKNVMIIFWNLWGVTWLVPDIVSATMAKRHLTASTTPTNRHNHRLIKILSLV